MAIGFFSKLADLAKKVGKGIWGGIKKVASIAAPIAGLVAPALQQSGNPTLAGIGTGLQVGAPIVQQLLGSRQ